jgi:hypothetical protein
MTLIVDLLLLSLGVVGSCEVVLRSPTWRHIARLKRSIGVAALRLPSSRVSDHWKALVARRYATDLLVSTFLIFGVLVIALAPIVAALWLVSRSPDAMWALALQPYLGIVLTIVAVGYLFVRTRARARG